MASTTTSKGFLKPSDGDTGATFFDDCITTIQQLSDHTHKGADSTQLVLTQTLAAAGAAGTSATGSNTAWVDDGSGTNTYVMTVTLPIPTIPNGGGPRSMQYDQHDIQLRLGSPTEIIYPRIIGVTSTTYKVYSNDNTISPVAYYI